MAKLLDLAAARAAIKFEAVLEHYGIPVEPKGKELLGRCPFHEEKKPSFRVNPEKAGGVFHCFGCGEKGNVLDFIAKKEGVSVRGAALLAGEWFGLTLAEKTRPGAREGAKRPVSAAAPSEVAKREGTAPPQSGAEPELKPLTFSLALDPAHPYLRERGLSAETVEVFGLGFCSRGILKGRIAIPIHNEEGRLVAYAGRWPGNPPEGEDKYKLPTGFPKAQVLFNRHRVAGAEHLVVVEGFFSVFRLHELHVAAVALMGSSLSPVQEKLVAGSGAKRLTLLMDGDEAGRKAAGEMLPRLAGKFFVRVVELPALSQPDTILETELLRLLGRETGVMGERILFDEVAAKAKVSRDVETLVQFSGVPAGTRGRVVRADAASHAGFSLGIEWNLPNRTMPLVDWFTKGEYERFLKEI